MQHFLDTVSLRVLPRHTEVTLYIVASLFLLTYFLEYSFRSLVAKYVDLSAGDVGSFVLFGALALGIVSAFVSAFMDFEVPLFRTILAPGFILVSNIFLVVEYVSVQSISGWVPMLFALYHSLWIYLLIRAAMQPKGLGRYIDNEFKTQRKLVIHASAFTVIIVLCLYFIGINDISWAVPISVTIFLWQFYETLI